MTGRVLWFDNGWILNPYMVFIKQRECILIVQFSAMEEKDPS